ncbi:MAG: hypothetical protein ACPGVI_04280 [Crocinitomicaceae bacterium]
MNTEDWKAKGRRNTINLGIWTFAWTLSMAIVSFGPKFIWNEDKTLTWVFLVLNFLLGIGMILANIKHINGLDELQKKIQLEAMGIALGVAVVSGLSYTVMDQQDLIPNDAEIAFLVMIIGVTYMGGLLIGQKRIK